MVNEKNEHGRNSSGRNGCANVLSERWMEKFLDFLNKYPEDIREKWKHSLSIHVQTQFSDGVPYQLILNPGRKDRLEIIGDKNIKIPNYRESIENYCKGLANTALFGEDYLPYYVLVNIFPIKVGHTTLANKEPNSYYGTNRKVTKSDLEIMVRFSDHTGSIVWHNMLGAAVSIPRWDHWQACICEPGVRHAKKERLSCESEVYAMPNYPGSNIVFRGESKINNTARAIDILNKQNISYIIGADNGYIYLVPVKNDSVGEQFYLDKSSRIGGFELIAMAYIALSEEDKKKALDISVQKILTTATYPFSELDSRNYF